MLTNEERKALLEKYPFMRWRNYYDGSLTEDPDYCFIDDIPYGWFLAFGEQMLDEIKEDLIRTGDIDRYHPDQIKEKFGALRWYDNGTVSESHIQDIIRKYEVISEHVCIECGKPDVAMCDIGWVSPYCSECYTSIPFVKKPYEDVVNNADKYIPNEYSYEVYSEGGTKRYTVDISDTVEKIRKRYNERSQKT